MLGLGNVYLETCLVLFTVALLAAAAQRDRSVTAAATTQRELRRRYLMGFVPAAFADWLQGPYFYDVHRTYGYSHSEIQAIFVVGFLSSGIGGVLAGSIADWAGRKRMCIAYAVIYATSCALLHVPALPFLLASRVLSGIGTALLLTCFDAWAAGKHQGGEGLASTLRSAYFGSSVAAIVAGLVAQVLTSGDMQKWGSIAYGGQLMPFALAIVVLTIQGGLVYMLWDEPPREASESPFASLATGVEALTGPVIAVGIVSSLFEATIYAFCLEWTPALAADKPPLGLVFAALLSGCMLGSQLFGFLVGRVRRLESVLLCVLVMAGCGLIVPVLTEHPHARFAGFVLYETSIGLYFPTIGTLKAMVVPEESRMAVYTLLRLPLNAFVVAVLTSGLSSQMTFVATTCMVTLASTAALWLRARRPMEAKDSGGVQVPVSHLELSMTGVRGVHTATSSSLLELSIRDHSKRGPEPRLEGA